MALAAKAAPVFFRLDAAGQIHDWSDTDHVTGYHQRELISHNFIEDVISFDVQDMVREHHMAIFDGDDSCPELDIELYTKDGRLLRVSLRGVRELREGMPPVVVYEARLLPVPSWPPARRPLQAATVTLQFPYLHHFDKPARLSEAY